MVRKLFKITSPVVFLNQVRYRVIRVFIQSRCKKELGGNKMFKRTARTSRSLMFFESGHCLLIYFL